MILSRWLRVLAALEREDFEQSDSLSERIAKARQYVDNRIFRAEVVASIPASAPPGYLMVTQGDPHLYIGRGQSSTLLRVRMEELP